MPKPMLLERNGKPCPYCLETMTIGKALLCPTTDHIVPKSRVREKRPRTIVVCSQCNFMKNNMTLSEFLIALELKNKEFQQTINKNVTRIKAIGYLIQTGLEA